MGRCRMLLHRFIPLRQGVNVQNNEIVNQRGLFIIDIQKSWLNGDSVVGARLLIAPNDFTSENAGAHNGPIVTLQGGSSFMRPG